MINLKQLDRYRVPYLGEMGNKYIGAFIIPQAKFQYQVIATEGLGWEHVSVSLKTNSGDMMERIPRWEEMCEIKAIFFKPEEVVMEVHPAESEYINDHPYVLHLWKPSRTTIPTPDSSFGTVGNEYNESRVIQGEKNQYQIFITADDNWKRIGVSLLDSAGKIIERMPKWSEMCEVKEMLFDPEEVVIQLHLPQGNETSGQPYTLYLWKPVKLEIPTPPSILVGLKKK